MRRGSGFRERGDGAFDWNHLKKETRVLGLE